MTLKRSLFNILLVVFLLFGFNKLSHGLEPKDFVQSTIDKASEILSSESSKDEKIVQLRDIAKNTVDIRGIGFYSLGSHRKSLDSDQKKEYLKIFEQYFLKSFSSRLAEYSNPKIRVDSQEKLNEKYTMVSSTLLAGEDKPEVKIDWRIVTKDPNNPLIIDVVIEGVSLAKVQKEEFNSIIQSNDGDIKKLFTTLQEFINQ